MDDLTQKIYDETYKAVYSDLIKRKQTDPSFTKSELEGLLNSYYANEGNNWVGQAEIKLTKQSASIAAFEAVLNEWSDD